jgi:PAS domain-containing protein
MQPQEKLENSIQFARAIFDSIPMPAFIVDENVQIQNFNTAAEAFLGKEPAAALHRRGGEVLHCIHAEKSGCGTAEACRDCIIRNSVWRAIHGDPTWRQQCRAELRTIQGVTNIDLQVTTSLLPYTEKPQVLLMLEIGG